MTRSAITSILIFSLALNACSRHFITTNWQSEILENKSYQNILVVAVLSDEDSSYRKTIEENVVMALRSIGYSASSGYVQFGSNGIVQGTPEKTYLKLCSLGYDAALVVAPLPVSKKDPVLTKTSFPDTEIYKRLWSYETIKINFQTTTEPFYWETVFFDLAFLRPLCLLESKQMTKEQLTSFSTDAGHLLAKRMVGDKILVKSVPVVKKAF